MRSEDADTKDCEAKARYWLEVTSGLRWERLMSEGIKLEAPNVTRHRSTVGIVRKGDFVLHYLTGVLTKERSMRSSIVATSRIASNPFFSERKIVVECEGTLLLPVPVRFREIASLAGGSRDLAKLVSMSMRRYLSPISESDFRSVVAIHRENEDEVSRWMKRYATTAD